MLEIMKRRISGYIGQKEVVKRVRNLLKDLYINPSRREEDFGLKKMTAVRNYQIQHNKNTP